MFGVDAGIIARNYKGFVEDMDSLCSVSEAISFILVRNYKGFVVDMDSVVQVNLHFSKELQ